MKLSNLTRGLPKFRSEQCRMGMMVRKILLREKYGTGKGHFGNFETLQQTGTTDLKWIATILSFTASWQMTIRFFSSSFLLNRYLTVTGTASLLLLQLLTKQIHARLDCQGKDCYGHY